MELDLTRRQRWRNPRVSPVIYIHIYDIHIKILFTVADEHGDPAEDDEHALKIPPTVTQHRKGFDPRGPLRSSRSPLSNVVIEAARKEKREKRKKKKKTIGISACRQIFFDLLGPSDSRSHGSSRIAYETHRSVVFEGGHSGVEATIIYILIIIYK